MYIDDIRRIKQQIFNVLKYNVIDDKDDDNFEVFRAKLKEYEETFLVRRVQNCWVVQ